MDCGSVYIKMCEQAEEIQKLFKEVVGDYLYMPKDGECAIVAENYREYRCLVELNSEKSFAFDDPYVWLLRQDQLQEMVGGHNQSRIDWIKWLEHCYSHLGYGNPFGYNNRFTSFEQEWLAFVMKEKYQKKWNGEKWTTD